MAVTRYEPWSVLNQLQNEIGRMFDTRLPAGGVEDNANVVTGDWVPAVDIKEQDDCFLIRADVPGVDPKDIDVHMEAGVLSITGHRESEKKEEREHYKRVERVSGTFYRRFALPDTADADKVSAKARNGVLEIVIPKHAKVQPRKITVAA